MKRSVTLLSLVLITIVIFVSACQPAAAPTDAPASEGVQPIETLANAEKGEESPQAGVATREPSEIPHMEEPAIEIPSPLPSIAPSPAFVPTQPGNQGSSDDVADEIWVEQRQIEFEYPEKLIFGDSDVVRLSIIPDSHGYLVKSEFPDHTTLSTPIQIDRPDGYELMGVASLDGTGFDISPAYKQEKLIISNTETHWRWSINPKNPGNHRLSISLKIHWEPSELKETITIQAEESEVFSRAFEIQVRTLFGLNRKQSFVGGVGGLIISSAMGLVALFWRNKPYKSFIEARIPDDGLIIETRPDILLEARDRAVIRSMFIGYRRLLVLREFLSGYSGARTLLVLPIQADGRHDAEAILKIGAKDSIEREYLNYNTYVKHTLPPITARIQRQPVAVPKTDYAALQYTFIAEPGKPPESLRRVLLENPSSQFLEKLFDTFGPNWWYQRKPYVYRLSTEFDRNFPSHISVVPVRENEIASQRIHETTIPESLNIKVGETIYLGKFSALEKRADGINYSLRGVDLPDLPPLRIRWLSEERPRSGPVRVVATRQSNYADWIKEINVDLTALSLPDPFHVLARNWYETVDGSKSIIHGDLNLENVLVGPGGFIWLIDFSETREGPPVQDIAHLTVEIIAHILSTGNLNDIQVADVIRNNADPLLLCLSMIAERCTKPGTQLREYHLGLLAASLGALKYSNLSKNARRALYITAAVQAEKIR
ncbi:MAG: hypothetical protein CVU39_20615 [Chloroflexi bacterium HGW-Chloroflexi-10]|nr:MAG: hypothetical protein CVU39_20615 [Chloroflexi bacterium HGW-Chloroflexi-10]